MSKEGRYSQQFPKTRKGRTFGIRINIIIDFYRSPSVSNEDDEIDANHSDEYDDDDCGNDDNDDDEYGDDDIVYDAKEVSFKRKSTP